MACELTLHNLRSATPDQAAAVGHRADEGFEMAEQSCGAVAQIALPNNWDDYLKMLRVA